MTGAKRSSEPDVPIPPPRDGGLGGSGGSRPSVRGEGRILTRGRHGRTQQHRTEQQRQPRLDPHPAPGATSTPLELSPSLGHPRLSRLSAALPAPAAFLRPFPGRPEPQRSQSPGAAECPPPNRRRFPAHLAAPPRITHWPMTARGSRSGFPRLGHGLTDMAPANWWRLDSSLLESKRESPGLREGRLTRDYKSHNALHWIPSASASGKCSAPWEQVFRGRCTLKLSVSTWTTQACLLFKNNPR